MAQSSLVMQQLDAGSELASAFEKVFPVRAAFWLQEGDDGKCWFYLTSDKIDDDNVDQAYREVLRILRTDPQLWLDPFQVKVIKSQHPIARDVIELQRKYGATVGNWVRGRMLGNIFAEVAFIYPADLQIKVGN